MSSNRFILEQYRGRNSRFICPGCGKANEFTRYLDTERGEYLAEYVGRCNREVNCGYHYTPKQYFEDNQYQNRYHREWSSPRQPLRPEATPASYIPFKLFQRSLRNYAENHFVRYLICLFGPNVTLNLIERFYIGTSKHWRGATIFWQIDIKRNIRSGKIMLYYPETGKRVKEPFNHITWAHSILEKQGKIQAFNLRQCLFGEHQLSGQIDNSPIAIVESEKTAIIASVYLPEFIWLACGSLTNLTWEKCRIIERRKIVLFPDLNCLGKWQERARQIQAQLSLNITVSDLLERRAPEIDKSQGLDLADYLIRFDVKHMANEDGTSVMLAVEADHSPNMINTSRSNGELNGAKIPEPLPLDVIEQCFNTDCPALLEFKQGRAYCPRCRVYQRIVS